MPEARRRYTWTIRWDDPLMASEVAGLVGNAAHIWCTMRPRQGEGQGGTGWRPGYGTPTLAGDHLGVLQVSIVIQGHDRWDVGRRAKRFAVAVAAAARVELIQLGEPTPEKLPPHTNRGYSRVRITP